MKDFSLAVILFFSIVMRAQNPLPTFSRFIGPGTAWNMVTVPYGFEQEEKPIKAIIPAKKILRKCLAFVAITILF